MVMAGAFTPQASAFHTPFQWGLMNAVAYNSFRVSVAVGPSGATLLLVLPGMNPFLRRQRFGHRLGRSSSTAPPEGLNPPRPFGTCRSPADTA